MRTALIVVVLALCACSEDSYERAARCQNLMDAGNECIAMETVDEANARCAGQNILVCNRKPRCKKHESDTWSEGEQFERDVCVQFILDWHRGKNR